MLLDDLGTLLAPPYTLEASAVAQPSTAAARDFIRDRLEAARKKVGYA